uniref:Neurotransmitter-gated ion-channel transmembrane domain-containing protein n=1 Tax=Meloidogyne javanica TaxID=6303 RepID=A0A915N4W4_MELJA
MNNFIRAVVVRYDFYIDITFRLVIRRKTLFFIVNLVIPSILTVFVFYIPACEHKMTYSSDDGTLHTMPRWIYRLFIRLLPKLLLMNPPEEDAQSENDESTTISDTQAPSFCAGSRRPSPFFVSSTIPEGELRLSQLAQMRGLGPDVLRRMLDNVHFIADYFRAKQKRDKVSENWSYVAFVLDRLLLIIFSTTLLVGTILILSSSPPATREWGEPLTTMRPTKPLSGDTFEFELRGETEVDKIL